MKTKFFTLFAAMMLLFGAKAMAQTNGDVNGDGIVNIGDVAELVNIILYGDEEGTATPVVYGEAIDLGLSVRSVCE